MKDRKPEPYEMPWKFGVFMILVIIPGLLAIMAASAGISPSQIWAEAKPQLKWIFVVPATIALFLVFDKLYNLLSPRIRVALYVAVILLVVVASAIRT